MSQIILLACVGNCCFPGDKWTTELEVDVTGFAEDEVRMTSKTSEIYLSNQEIVRAMIN